MKPASSGLIALLNNSVDFLIADLWEFQLRNGITLYYTDADIDLVFDGNTYVHNNVLVTGGALKQTRGLEPNDTDVTCYPNVGMTPSMVGSTPFLQSVTNGMFDRAIVTRRRLFMPTWGDTSLGALVMFVGEMVDPDITRYTAPLHCKDVTNLLNIYMPRRQYQPTCAWVFGDSNCTVDRTALAVSSSAIASTSGSSITCDLSNPAGYFNSGVIKFTSGANANSVRTVKQYSVGTITLVAPFPNPIAAGDTFTATPGCSKSFAAPTNSVNAAAGTASTPSSIVTRLTNADGYFNGGTLQFTSGSNLGQTRPISIWIGGVATMSSSFPNQPTIGDQCVLTAVTGNTQSTCLGYNNQINFGGEDLIPIPETAY